MNHWIQAALMALLLFLLTYCTGRIGLPLLQRLQVGQTVRDDGPQSHLKKTGTPTFGGLFFLVPLVITTQVLWLLRVVNAAMPVLMLLMLMFAFAGFLDDWIKVRISKKGLSVLQKTWILAAISVLFTVYYLYFSPVEPFLLLPFMESPLRIIGWVRIPYGIAVILYLFFVSNSVNLTDGVDGLASSVTAICCVFLGIAAIGTRTLTADSPSVWLLAFALCGSCCGFLIFNRHPAKVFMGDTGSQALGAGVAGIALLMGLPWLIAITGIIYMSESFSVMIQVAYFKKTGGKRIFRMSPLHHHYELGGWSENKIVRIFSLVTLLAGGIGLLLIWPALSW